MDRLEKAHDLAARFIRTVDEEVTAQFAGVLPPTDQRCQRTEDKTFRRCTRTRGHSGKCQFTSNGSASTTAITEIVKFLTGSDCAKLSGLDDVKVLKGTDNWKRLHRINDQNTACIERRRIISKRIKEQELFYQTDFVPHLKPKGDMQCNCLSCGFFDKGKQASADCCRAQTRHLLLTTGILSFLQIDLTVSFALRRPTISEAVKTAVTDMLSLRSYGNL